ncbi:HNH endonuclease [Kribbella italica]|uniref:HNH nuclease domain-containing protein n=1 Tax=Kribbella italica TaxID=1540520 RepID=A0A7W9JA91_9ACTN|nr:hypothetical protein [Kribbella italica]
MCDPECQRKKQEEEDRRKTEKALEDQEDRAQTIPVIPPGSPGCSAANPSLCPSQPTRPADQNGGYVDRTTQTGGSADLTYQNAVTTLGSTIGSVTQTGSLGSLMTTSMNLPMICRCGGGSLVPSYAGGGGNIGLGLPPGTMGGGFAGAVGVVVVAGTGVLLIKDLSDETSDNPYVRALTGSGAAQPPDDEDDCREDPASCTPEIKPGAANGETSGKAFPPSVRKKALEENPDTCVYCRMLTGKPQVDHSIPKSRGGDATLPNAQTTCPHCNASKRDRNTPVNPPPGYTGAWPPSWWPIFR